MRIELVIPDDWTPWQAIAMRTIMQRALRSGHPVVGTVRPDATPDQVQNIYRRLGTLIREAGLAA